MEKAEEFKSFLKNVEQISQLVRDLQSSEAEMQQKALAKADCYIAALDRPCSTKVNKTIINTNLPLQPNLSAHDESLENFMKIMEKDAEERKVKRMAQVKKATAHKDKGNEAYAREDYETAVKHYSDGLAELKDMQPLYTNRAQAHIKLGKYKEAISDCEMALKCDERCTKAYLHMGKAYLGLKKYSEARNCFEKIQEIEPGRKNMVKEYLDLAGLEEERETQEMNARQEFNKGGWKATAVPQLLEKLSRPHQMPLYYCGGLEILSQAVTECTEQTLFRLNNGFSIISSNDTVKSCLLQKTNDPDSQELCVSVLQLWKILCCENDENQKILMACPVARESFVQLVTSEHVAVGKKCLALLCLYSKTAHGRRLAINNLNLHMLVKNLMVCISEPKQQREDTAVYILKNFAAEDRFCILIRSGLKDSVTVPFVKLLGNISKSSQHILQSLVSALSCLARDDVIRQNLANDQQCWQALLDATRQCCVPEYKEVLYLMLGLIINLTAVTSPAIQEHAVSLCDCCLGLLKDTEERIRTRATGVLSTILPQSSEAVHHVIQAKAIQTMCNLLKVCFSWETFNTQDTSPPGLDYEIPSKQLLLKGTQLTTTKYAIKTLTVCTAASRLAREELVKSDKKLSILRDLLSSSCDEMIPGNAALCLAHCLELEGVATHLLGTDIVLKLLRHAASDTKRTAVQKNAAIALGKLCRSETRSVAGFGHSINVVNTCVPIPAEAKISIPLFAHLAGEAVIVGLHANTLQ